MKPKRILVKGGHIWTAHEDCVADIFVSDGKIQAIGRNLGAQYTADEVMGADGLYVLPGGVDAHTHMELPFMGTCSADDFETGTLAGLYGGTTTIIDFAIQGRSTSLMDSIRQWHEKAKRAVGDYSFHCALTEYNESLKRELPAAIEGGVTSFKVFMAYKNALMIEDRFILELMEDAKKYGALLSVHAEHGDIIDLMTDRFRRENNLSPRYHALAHPPEAEGEAAGRIMELANFMGVDIYIVHTTYRGVLERMRDNIGRGQRVWIETCPQYLLLDDSCYDEPDFGGAKYVMSPPIRKKEDQASLWDGINLGLVQVVGTDHCPFNFKGQKDMGRADFSKIPSGGPGIENRLELMFSEGVLKNRISMNRFVEVVSTNPARIFGLPGKGGIAVGYDADLVIFDPKQKHKISAKTHHQNVDYNLYEGRDVTGKVKAVIANGHVVVRDGKADEIEKGGGRFIKRRPYRSLL